MKLTAIIMTLLFLIAAIAAAVSGYYWHDYKIKYEEMEKQMSIFEARIERKTDFFETLIEGTKLFLDGNYEEATVQFSKAESFEANNVRWGNKAKNFIEMYQAEIEAREELAKGNSQLGTNLSEFEKLLAEKEELLAAQETEGKNYSTQIASLNSKLSAMMKKSTSLENEVLSMKSKYKSLRFQNTIGKEVRYFGESEGDIANGFGIGIFDNQSFYEGEWRNGLRHGKGRYVWSNKHVYEGDFVDGKRHGKGTYTFATGEKYVGEWQADVRHGVGTFFGKDGKPLADGNWKNDEFVGNSTPDDNG